MSSNDQATSENARARSGNPAHRTTLVLLVLQSAVLLAVIASAVVAVAEVAESCRDLFTGRSELLGEGTAHYRIVPGAIEVTCEASTGRMAVPLNGAGACVFFAVVGLLLTVLVALTIRRARRW